MAEFRHAYPLYMTESNKDVWIANGKEGHEYNKIYDLYYRAGLSINQMRVSCPLAKCKRAQLYRVLKPGTWARVVSRVNGANFAAMYGNSKLMGAGKITLPKGHTWRSYVKFLLATLPDSIRENYVAKFKTSIRFWWKKGGVVCDDALKELEACRTTEYGITAKADSSR